MACRELNITDFFRFAETEKIIDHEVTDLYFAEQKINSWWMDNSERIQLKKRLLQVNMYLDLVYSLDFRSDVLNKLLDLLNRYKLLVEYQLQLDLLGRRNNLNNDNPYNHTGNNPINNTDSNGTITLLVLLGVLTICGIDFYVFYSLTDGIIKFFQKSSDATSTAIEADARSSREEAIKNPQTFDIEKTQKATIQDPIKDAHDTASAGVDVGGTGMQGPPATPSTGATDAAIKVAEEAAKRLNK